MNLLVDPKSPSAAVTNDMKIAVIIPTYRHPVLLTEAIESVLAQTFFADVGIVIVSDGCPLVETDTVASFYAMRYSNIFYLRTPNGGPSAARNFGIDFVLNNWPSVEAFYFLDADNRLTPTALADAYTALMQDPEVGWIYPHITSFGISWSANYGVPYSSLLHIVYDNICDTGSLVARKVLESGVRFDEDARSGYEDWDFWLQCISHGFVGRHCPFGFSYRQRPESRYREMNRQRSAIIERLRRRHWSVAAPTNLLRLEHETNPRFLLVNSTEGDGRAFTDPARRGQVLSSDFIADEYYAACREPDQHLIWPYFAFGDQEAIGKLKSSKMLHGVFALLEREANKSLFVALVLKNSESEYGVSIEKPRDRASLSERTSIWMCRAQIMKDVIGDTNGDSWVCSLDGPTPEPDVMEVTVFAPTLQHAPNEHSSEQVRASALLTSFVKSMRANPLRMADARRWNWRPKHFPAREDYYKHMCSYVGVDRIIPKIASGKLEVGVIVPIASFGGSEKVAYAMARYLKKVKGANVNLFVLGKPVMKVLSEFEDTFDSITFLADGEFPVWGGPLTLFGQESFSPDSDEVKASELVGLMAGLDFVVNCHSAPMNAVMGRLRQSQRVKTASYLHVVDYTTLHRPVGHPYITVAFEHVYDVIMTCSQRLAEDIHSLGIPSNKIIPVPNAAGFSVSQAKAREMKTWRNKSRGSRPLRVVYLGRLDPQKGIERVLQVAQGIRRASLPVTLRVIGANLLDGVGIWASALHAAGVEVEPPLFTSDELAATFAWADVLLLPSFWEGAPLVIPECQQLGCIPLAADVGAVNELIDDGVDGILINPNSDESVADQAMRAIRNLLANDPLRKKMAEAALARSEINQWDSNFSELGTWIDDNFPEMIEAPVAAIRRRG